jgi:hypothetical protein
MEVGPAHTLYPSAPPQYRPGVSQLLTSQPLKQGYIATHPLAGLAAPV